MATALDQWEPKGEPIHPYDLYELLEESLIPEMLDLRIVETYPRAEDEMDYVRNYHKMGTVMEFGGKLYFETATVAPVTKRWS